MLPLFISCFFEVYISFSKIYHSNNSQKQCRNTLFPREVAQSQNNFITKRKKHPHWGNARREQQENFATRKRPTLPCKKESSSVSEKLCEMSELITLSKMSNNGVCSDIMILFIIYRTTYIICYMFHNFVQSLRFHKQIHDFILMTVSFFTLFPMETVCFIPSMQVL